MMRSLNPIPTIWRAVSRSRLLRVALIVAGLTTIALVILAISGRVHPWVALMLVVFDAGTWYFATAAAAGIEDWDRLQGRTSPSRVAVAIELLCQASIIVVQALLLLILARLREG